MKKYFTFGLIMSLVAGACFAEHPMITQLIREKQQKMEKLEKCKGTTKNLKIAGISTLGITAVGVGANIAEAVVLDKTKGQVKQARDARDVQLLIKESRQELEKFCGEIGGDMVSAKTACVKYVSDNNEYNGLVSMMRQNLHNCETVIVPRGEQCTIGEDGSGRVSVYLYQDSDQNNKEQASDQGNKEQNSETTQTHSINETLSLAEIAEKIKETLTKPESKCSDASAKATWTTGYTWNVKCDEINHTFTFAGVKCDANKKFADGECMAEAQAKKPLKQRCDEAYGQAGQERLLCCYAGGATEWNDKTSTCSCVKSDQEWKGGKCVAKPGDSGKGSAGGDGKSGGNGGNNPAQTPNGGNNNGADSTPAAPKDGSQEDINKKIAECNNNILKEWNDQSCVDKRKEYIDIPFAFTEEQVKAYVVENNTCKNPSEGDGVISFRYFGQNTYEVVCRKSTVYYLKFKDFSEPVKENKNPSPTGLSSQYFGEAQAICEGAYGIKGELHADGSGYYHCSGITETDCATLNTKDPYIRFVYTDVPGHGTRCWVFHE